VLFVTGHAPPDRIGAFARLHELEGIELALFGGRLRHGPGTELDESEADPEASRTGLPVPHRQVRQRTTGALASSGRYRAVVCSTAGRVAPLASWAGARRARAPVILWASLWAHPRSAAQLLGYPLVRRLYASADAVVTYGPHVSAYVAARGARNVHVAPQSVDNSFWSAASDANASDPAWPGHPGVRFLFAGRPTHEKGLPILLEAWSRSRLRPPGAGLALVGAGARAGLGQGIAGVSCSDVVGPQRLRQIYASAHVLVVPSIATATFREPWGLVINEAMNQGVAVVCSDAVGAAAGGLVRAERNGVIVPAGDCAALAHALRRVATDGSLRARLGAAGAEDVQAYTHEAWARGFSDALSTVGLSRQHW
jgi:glycosyltransferase involved in cell wall biosynthesis